MSMWDAYRKMSFDCDAGYAPQDCSNPMEMDEHREQVLAHPLLGIDTYDIGCPISGDARVHFDMAVLRGWIETE